MRKDFSIEVKNLIESIKKAENVVIYGAKQRAQEIIPVCEALIRAEKISVATSNGGGYVLAMRYVELMKC